MMVAKYTGEIYVVQLGFHCYYQYDDTGSYVIEILYVYMIM